MRRVGALWWLVIFGGIGAGGYVAGQSIPILPNVPIQAVFSANGATTLFYNLSIPSIQARYLVLANYIDGNNTLLLSVSAPSAATTSTTISGSVMILEPSSTDK